MKAEVLRTEPVFKPIILTITCESQKELDNLFDAINESEYLCDKHKDIIKTAFNNI